jgi:hypothetical protein
MGVLSVNNRPQVAGQNRRHRSLQAKEAANQQIVQRRMQQSDQAVAVQANPFRTEKTEEILRNSSATENNRSGRSLD